MLETRVQSLGQEDPLKTGMATHSSILAEEIPRTEEPGGLQSLESQRVRRDWVTDTTTIITGMSGVTTEGNNPQSVNEIELIFGQPK